MKKASWINNLGLMRPANIAVLGQVNSVSIEKKKKGQVISAVKEWEKIRKIQEKAFDKAGIVECELRLKMCNPKMFVAFAHGKKRSKLQGSELANLLVRACQPCHEHIEYKIPQSEMLEIIKKTIKQRKVKVPEL